jgi:two-component system NtrC family sensor kinase
MAWGRTAGSATQAALCQVIQVENARGMMELPDRILVVDDQARIRDLMETTLRAQDYLVETAADGREALAMLTGETFALIVADLVMPDVNGLELLTEVKKLAPMAEVILVTAHGSVESATEALRQGAHDYIIKPFDLKGFEHSVQRALAYRRLKLEKLSLLDSLQSESDELRRVLAASNRLTRLSPSPDLLLDDIVEIAQQNLGLTAAIITFDENGQLLQTSFSPDFQKAWRELLCNLRLTEEHLRRFFTTVHSFSHSYLIKPNEQDIASLSGLENNRPGNEVDKLTIPLLAIPLGTHTGRIIGVLWITGIEFSSETIQRLEIFANQVAGTIENANHFAAQSRQVCARNALLEAGQRIATVLEEREVVHTILQAALKIMPQTELIVIYRRSDAGTELIPVGLTLAGQLVNSVSHIEESLVAEALQSKRTVYRPEWTDRVDQRHKPLIIEPLIVGDVVLGALVAICQRPIVCSEDHLQIFTMLAQQAAVALQNAHLYADARKLDELEALHEAGQFLNRTLDLQETLTTTLSIVRSLTGASISNVYLYTPEHHRIDSVVTLDDELALSNMDRRRSAEIAWDVLSRALADGPPPEGDNGHHHNLFFEPIAGEQEKSPDISPTPGSGEPTLAQTGPVTGNGHTVQTWLAVPLIASGSPVGVLQLGAERADAFTPDDVRLIQIIASQSARAIQNARLYEEAQQRLQQTEALDTISQSISNTLNIQHVLELVVHWATKTIPIATHSTLYLLDEAQEDYVLAAEVNKPNRPSPLELEPVRLRTIQEAARRHAPVHQAWYSEEHGSWSLLVAPLKADAKVIGVISLESPCASAFLASDERLLNTFASHASIAIQNANLFHDLWDAYTDLAHHQEEILRSHRTLQALFDGITDGLYILDRDMRIVTINQAEAKRLGTKPEALLDQPCDITLWGDAIETVTQIVLNTFETGEEGNWESQQDTARRGPFVDRDLRTYPIFRPSGEVDQVILFAQDVAEKRQLQASLFRSANLAAVGQLASSIAHQINNPLTVVIANTQLMQMDTEPTSPDYEMIKDVMGAAARISRIVQNLLDFSNQASYAWVETDLEANIDDALNFVAHSLRKGNIRVVKDIAGLPPIIASANHLKLLWLNLLLNAQDAITARENTLDEKGTIEVHVTQVDSSYVQVQIIDNGVGIPLQHHQLLFHPFFTTKPPGKGLGLGLYTCRIITEHHQGQIEIDSGDGNPGTIVTVTLPIRAAHPSGEAAIG